MNFVLWILPFIVLAASFLSYKLNVAKSLRYKIYILVLFVVFLFDLMHISFVKDQLDTIRFLLVTFIIGDIGWNVLHIKKNTVKIAFVLIGLIAFSWVYMGWIVDGPQENYKHWSKKIVEQYKNHKNRVYILKESVAKNKEADIKKMTLCKVKKLSVLEEEVREYRLPEGYEAAVFDYGWSNTLNGVRLDLVNGQDTIWTLGEGF